MLGIEPAFQEFQDTLFSPASMTLERSVQSKEVNEKLDAGISLFLTRLCPYFLLKPAHKCIEWLVHRYVTHAHTHARTHAHTSGPLSGTNGTFKSKWESVLAQNKHVRLPVMSCDPLL